MPRTRRRRRFSWLLFLLLVVAPILEIAVIVLVGRSIGGWRTFGLLVLSSVIGAWLVKREWKVAWRALRSALETGRMPARELSDAALVLIGGTMMLAPGFISDVIGLFLILPFTRSLSRPLLQAAVARRLLANATFVGPDATRADWDSASQVPRRSDAADEIIEGEIVDD